MKPIYDENEVRKGLAMLHPDGEIFEVRMISADGKTNYSGYFRDGSTLMDALRKIDLRGFNIYTTVNPVNPACYARNQHDKFVKNVKNTTSDSDVSNLTFLFIDLDPKRPTGVSSSDEELQKAKALGNKIFAYLRSLGFYTPMSALSGNGVHLLYKVNLPNTPENTSLLKRCLEVLDAFFSTEDVEVDRKNYNPSRICKLYGTLAQKGYDTEERPYRMSRMMGEPPQPLEITEVGYLEKLANMLPQEPEKPQRYNNYSPRDFDIEDWMDKHGIQYRKASYMGGKKYILDHCPFDSNHNGKDACIFRSDSGAIGFHCFHNHCADKTWRDVRILFEPDAYEKREKWLEHKMYHSYNRDRVREPVHITEEDGSPVFYTAKDILNMPEREETFVRTGITVIDKKLRGLRKGAVSLMSGLRGASKSTVLSQWALTAINEGANVGMFSGELAPRNLMKWMYQQAAGRGRVVASEKWEGYYTVPSQTQQKIAEWLGEHFWLYNNEYGNDFQAIEEQFSKAIEEKKLDMLILDNLMAFNISGLAETKWEAQTAFVWRLHDLAHRNNVHVIFVAHPRKANSFLRLDDISGSADLANAVDNAFIVHRNNKDFYRLTKEMFKWKDDDEIYQCTNIIEIAKDRDGGTQDEFIPLWYERESKRLKNNPTEAIVYGWDGDPAPQGQTWMPPVEETQFEDMPENELVFD